MFNRGKDIPTVYVRQMRLSLTGVEATWTPTDERAVGEVGARKEDHRFDLRTTLKELKVPVRTRNTAVRGDIITYDSSGTAQLTANGGAHAGAGPAKAGGSVTVKLEAGGSVYFMAYGCHWQHMTNLKTAAAELGAIQERKNGDWRPGYRLVTDVLHARRIVVVIAHNKAATVELEAKAGNIAAGPLDFLKTAAGLSRSSTTGGTLEFLTEEGKLTPLYMVRELRKQKVGDPVLTYLEDPDDPDAPETPWSLAPAEDEPDES